MRVQILGELFGITIKVYANYVKYGNKYVSDVYKFSHENEIQKGVQLNPWRPFC